MSETPLEQRRKALRAVDAWLKTWAVAIAEEPGPPISSVYGAQTPPVRDSLASQQERWVMTREWVLRIDQAVKALPLVERRVVERKYRDLANWKVMAIELKTSIAQVRQIHETALTILAQTLGFMGGDAGEQAEQQEAA